MRQGKLIGTRHTGDVEIRTDRLVLRQTLPDGTRLDLLLALEDGTPVGEILCRPPDDQPASDAPGEVWVACALRPEHRGQGYAAEAMRAVVTWLRSRQVERVFASVSDADSAPRKLLDLLGFQEHERLPPEPDGTSKVRMALTLSQTDDLLSQGMVAFVGIAGRFDSTPNEERVVQAIGDAAYDLIPRIKTILDELYQADPPLWNVATLTEMGRGAEGWLRIHHPTLSDQAIDAVTNRFTYDWK